MKILILKVVWGTCHQAPLDDLGLTLELNLGLKKSDDFILSGKWQPCVRAHCQLEKKTAHLTDPIPWHSSFVAKD